MVDYPCSLSSLKSIFLYLLVPLPLAVLLVNCLVSLLSIVSIYPISCIHIYRGRPTFSLCLSEVGFIFLGRIFPHTEDIESIIFFCLKGLRLENTSQLKLINIINPLSSIKGCVHPIKTVFLSKCCIPCEENSSSKKQN